MWEVFEPGLRQRLSALDEQASTSDRVRAVLLEMLPAGMSSIDAVAQRLALSKRSLQRHLGDESVSFQDVLNQVRQELAQHYLVNSNISPGEISWLLGFQESNSFVRAFRSWTGKTPSAYRLGCESGAPHLH
jgi:AraC-like DNA-binding protein